MKNKCIIPALAAMLSFGGTVWAQIGVTSTTNAGSSTVFLEEGFEDDTVSTSPDAPAVGTWTIPTQTISAAGAIVTNDIIPGPYSGANYLRIYRSGAENTARIEAVFGTVPLGDTVTATFAFLYESTGVSSAAIRLMSGATQRVVILAEPDYSEPNFYSLDGTSANPVYSSLAVTPGTWQTLEIQYTSGSSDLTLTVNGSSETLAGAVTGGTIDRIRFNTGAGGTVYYLDSEIKVVATNAPPVPMPFLDDGFEDDTVGTNPNPPTTGSWVLGSLTTDGATVMNDASPGPFAGTNYLRIQRTTGFDNTSEVNAVFQTSISVGNTINITFAFQYESTGTSSATLRLMDGSTTQRAEIVAEPDYGEPNFYAYNGAAITSSLPVTPGTWQTIGIQYTTGSSDLTLTVNGTSETLVGAVTGGAIDRIRFNTGAGGTTYYLDALSSSLTVAIAPLPDKNERLTFTGNRNSSYVVQVSTNLVNWNPISTNTSDDSGQFIYDDLKATNYLQRFYRGMSQ